MAHVRRHSKPAGVPLIVMVMVLMVLLTVILWLVGAVSFLA
jgi:hypothetical protein